MGTLAYWRTIALVGLGAALWVTGAMMVAFPGQTFTMNFAGMFSAFLGNVLHPVSIILLWGLDVVIVIACLQDSHVRAAIGHWLGAVLVAILVFVVVTIVAPIANPELYKTYTLAMGVIAMLSITVARALSYVAAQQGTPI